MEIESLQPRIRALSRRLTGIADLASRVDYLAHHVSQMPTATVAEMVVVITRGAEIRASGYAALFQSFSLAIGKPACAALRLEVARLLHAIEQPILALMVFEADDDAMDEEAHRVPDFGWGRPVSLGERKSIARRRDRDLIARVLRDPHPDVIGILLGNPALTETDVLRLSARRPIRPVVLRQVFQTPRWNPRYAVKIALALNPCCPLDVRLKLAPQLIRTDLRRVLEGGHAPPPLDHACRRLLRTGTVR